MASLPLDQERSIRQVLYAAFAAYRHRPWLFTILSALVVVIYDVAVLAVTGRGPFGQFHKGLALFTVANAAQILIVAPVIAVLHVDAVIAISEGRRPELSWVAVSGLRRLPAVITAQIICYLGIAIAALFFIVPGILLGLRWCIVALVVAVENQKVGDALRRSGRLAAGRYWHIFVLTITIECVALLAALGVGVITGGSSGGANVIVLEVLVQTMLAAYAALTLTMLYFDLNARQAR